MSRMRRLHGVVLTAILAACSSPSGDGAPATAGANASGAANPATQPAGATVAPGAGALSITITRSTYGLLSAQTAAGASCRASARLPSGSTSTAQGLDTHNADASGNITWTYRTVSNTTKGTGTYTVTCSAGGQNKTVTAPFTVQ
jgi:hypothetical protein